MSGKFVGKAKRFRLSRVETHKPGVSQLEIQLRSAFRITASVTGLSTIIKRLISSAKIRMFAPMSFIMSLI